VTAPVLADALGPRARRRTRVASVAAALLVVAFLVVAYNRLSDRDQLAEEKWKPLTEWPVLRFLLGGLGNTLKAAAVAVAFAMTIGGLMALARLARHVPQRWLATLYIEFFRGLPLYLLLLFCAFGLPQLGVRLEPFWYLVIGLSVYNSSILAEIFRAGILSLDRGQSEAAFSLGLGYWQSMGLVVIPQAVRRMVPAVVSQLVTLLKDTSLGVLIFYEELLRRARITGEFYQNPVHAIALAALFYIAVNSLLSVVARRLEARQRRRYGAGAIQVAGAEDVALTQAEATAKV
jgi:glutamate transport system permease protein